MPYSPLRPCLEPYCPGLTRNGSRCEEHRRARVRQRSAARGTRQSQGYDSDYQRAKARTIQAQPFCSACGTTVNLSADHIIPLSRGGTSDAENLRTLCVPCNSRRGNR